MAKQRASPNSRGAYCASACTLALAGGVERYISPQSYIGVHQMTEVIKQTQVKKLYKVHYLKFAGIKLELSRHFVGETEIDHHRQTASPTIRSTTTSPTISPKWASPTR